LDNISGSRLNTNGGTIKRLIFSYFAYGNTGTPYEQTIFNGRILLIKPDFSYTFIPYSNKGWGWAEYIEITDYVNKTSPDGWYYVSFIGSKVAPQAAWSMTAVYENGRTLPNSYTKLVLKQQQIANASVDIRFPIPYQINGTYQITGTILGGGIGAWPGAPNETNDRVFAILKDGSTKQLYETYYNGRTIFAGRSSSDFACGIFNTEKNHSVRGGELDIFNETLRSDFFGNKELVGIRFTKDGNNGISVGLVGVSAPLK
ncbi:MAG: hypothetical protein IKI04_03110, partial [Bacilli bacterium]|nr:hypothetical protein [Bacilli bacterium]